MATAALTHACMHLCTHFRFYPTQALPEFHDRVTVLQRLGYLDSEKAVTLKGRVLCEINSTQASG